MLPPTFHPDAFGGDLRDAVTIVRDRPTRFTTNTPAGAWPAATLPVTFFLGATPSRDVGDAAGPELDVAIRTWPHAPCTSYRARYGGVDDSVAADDGIDLVLFHDDVWPPDLVPGVVAQTVVHADSAGAYRDADIHLNSAAFHFSLDGKDGTLDLRSVLVHELGHALGLGHVTDPRATMYPSGSGVRWRSLEADDVAGVCALYPAAAGSGGSPGCDVDPCPAAYVCVGGACQRRGDRADLCSPCVREPGACDAAGDDARCIDIGAGETAGRVCGRRCATDTACSPGFHCRPTSTSGDLQCVSDDGCRSAANACATDAECTDSLCPAGACVGAPDPAAPDAGGADAGASADASITPASVTPGGGGGGCVAAGSSRARSPASTALLFSILLGLLVTRSVAVRARRGH